MANSAHSDVGGHYDGSRLLLGVAESLGLTVDKVNFLVSQLIALVLASLFRTILHPSTTSAAARHVFGLIFALVIGYFCFGMRAIHLAALPASCYVVIRTQSPHVVQRMVMVVSLSYLSVIHMQRQNDSHRLDITGPLMVITQKVTSLAYSIHDGLTKTDEEMTKDQKKYAVKSLPSPLEYFAFVLQFPTLLVGPAMFYKEYSDFIDGTDLAKMQNASLKSGDKLIVIEPSPTWAVFKKIVVSAICAVIFVKLLPLFPIERLKEDDFVENTSLFQKMSYFYICTTLVRFKFYFAWSLADAISNAAGMGYNGDNEDGTPNWDKFTNVDILKFEFAQNMKESTSAWNLGTNRWLRMVVYDRVDNKYSVYLTYSLSAIWHGFYPGYYLTFASGALFTIGARVMRKTVRNNFLGNSETKLFYDVITFILTRVSMAYIVFPFVLLEFWPCIRLYTRMFWCLHLCVIGAIFLVPKMLPKTSEENNGSKSRNCTSLISQARPITNEISRHHD